MAQRRMMSLKIIDTDNFLSMPLSSRLLYYDLIIRADDDGFVSSPRKIMKITGCSEDDFSVLCAKQYIFPFKTGVCVIKDWRIHNYIQSDRYTSTHYQDEFKQLKVLENGTYEPCAQNVSIPATQVRLGKVRLELGKDRLDTQKYNKNKIPPTIEEVKEYLKDKNITCVDPESFIAYYGARGWVVKGGKVKDWTCCVTTWVKNSNKFKPEHKKAGHVDKEFSTDF